jgi:nicotinamide-nucleotide amidase
LLPHLYQLKMTALLCLFLELMNATIITIGDELLIGQVIDTNSAWMAQQLNAIGIKVSRRVAVGDNKQAIIEALNQERKTSNIIFLTGGLGPTADDITKPLLAQYFGGTLISNAEVEAHIRHLFEFTIKKPVTERNLKQAELPSVCKPLFNRLGTAPGMLFEDEGLICISLPGVPVEMMGLMEDAVLPELKKRFDLLPIRHKTVVTFGTGESVLADMLEGFEASLPTSVSLAYLPNHGMVRLRLSSSDHEADLENLFAELKSIVNESMIADEDFTMEQIVSHLLKKNHKQLATAESCTGGYIAHLISAIPGASEYYQGSMITYSYDAKEKMLGVSHETLVTYGAVSEQVVLEMANGLLEKVQTDYAVAVSGIMGPGGGMPDKPVGTVWMAAGRKGNVKARKYQLRFNRSKNIQLTAMFALNMVRESLLEDSTTEA